jgi:hypothetical protein
MSAFDGGSVSGGFCHHRSCAQLQGAMQAVLWQTDGVMRRVALTFAVCLAAASVIAAEEPRLTLVKALGLIDAQRDSLETSARAQYSARGKFPEVKDCLDRKATDERLAVELSSVTRQHASSEAEVREALQFLKTPAGRKFAAAVAQRNRTPPGMLGRNDFFVAGVKMSQNEVTPEELQAIREFFSSDAGSQVGRILQDTTGFQQLSRTIKLMSAYTAECGLDLKPPAK